MTTQSRGQSAKELLANPLLQDTLQVITSALIEEWEHCKDSALREELWMTLQGQKRFKTLLEMTVEKAEEERLLKEKFDE